MSGDDRTLRALLTRRAAATPDATFAVFPDGPASWTFAETLDVTARTGHGLQQLGVAPGDRVLCWMPNGPVMLRAWFGTCWIGGTSVPVNTSLRGRLLEHVIRTSRARVMVAHPDLVPRLEGLDLSDVRTLVVVGEVPADGPPGVEVLAFDDLDTSRPAEPAATVDADVQSIIYTSGTTGPSKGVLSSYGHLWATGDAAFGGRLGPDDRYLVNLPLFHAGGTIGVYGMLAVGGSIAVVDTFSTPAFWNLVRRSGVTSCTLLGVMATFLMKQPAAPDDADNPLRLVYMVPLVEDARRFADRFGCSVMTLFNMTEVSCPLVSEVDPPVTGTCGRPRPGVEVRLVDADGRDVADEEVGELWVRTTDPLGLASGYDGMAEATAASWSDGWFRTGDCFRRSAAGDFTFVDRVKDAIRRRGENISSFEVEAEVLAHPDVREAAAVAVPSPDGEDEVLVVVAPVAGRELDPAEVVTFLIPRMAHYMVPRYVRVVDALPMTPTSKVEKHRLRGEGLTVDTYDREAHGVRLRKERLA